ncbi:MAG: hypothetical protein RLZZ297_1509 [Chloroflexota bacterium]|jgi:hypothetical protein
MKIGLQEFFIIIMVVGFTVGFAFRAGLVRGRKRRSKE